MLTFPCPFSLARVAELVDAQDSKSCDPKGHESSTLSPSTMNTPLIIALDGLERAQAYALARELSSLVWGYKVHELLVREGFEVIAELKKYGNVFVDLKFHDIPATVEKEVTAMAEYGTDIITVHASGGAKMLEAAVRAGGTKVAAVTLLTSLSPEAAVLIYQDAPKEIVKTLATEAARAGVANIVCSAHEIGIVREAAPLARIIVPGIRLAQNPSYYPDIAQMDDQVRITTAREAIDAGADFLVIGRPVTKAPNPRAALEAIIRDH